MEPTIEITIGDFTIIQPYPSNPDVVTIERADGKSGVFDKDTFEKAIDEFFKIHIEWGDK